MKTCKKENCNNKVFSKGFCKFHCEKKPIKKQSFSKIEKNKEKKEFLERLHNLYLQIWKKRKHECCSCKKNLGKEPLLIYFDHLLEKNIYPEFAEDEDCIVLVCGDCHAKKTAGFPTEKHQLLINEFKKEKNI